jgi:hypothetical protein
MPSSTSSSDAAFRRAILYFLAGVVVWYAVLEFGGRYLTFRLSRIEGRVNREFQAALQVRSPNAFLLTGNSLLDEGVDVEKLRSALAPDWQTSRFVIEQTVFHDWKYGLPHLAANGSQPGAFGLVLSVTHTLMTATRGDYSAHFLFSPADTIRLGNEVHYHPTQTFGLLVSSVSRFFGVRTEIRKVLLGRLLPGMGELSRLFIPPPGRHFTTEEAYRIGTQRMRDWKGMEEKAGRRIVLILHPSPERNDGTEEILRAARENNVVAIAGEKDSFLETDFLDGHHLNPVGAAKFTRQLAAQLPKALQK